MNNIYQLNVNLFFSIINLIVITSTLKWRRTSKLNAKFKNDVFYVIKSDGLKLVLPTRKLKSKYYDKPFDPRSRSKITKHLTFW